LGADTAPYRKITTDGVRVKQVLGKDMLVVSREALRALSEAAFGDINHYLRPGAPETVARDSRRSPSQR
jgi:fumarate hydratase class I